MTSLPVTASPDATFRLPVPRYAGRSLLDRLLREDEPDSLEFEVRLDAVRIVKCWGGQPLERIPEMNGIPLAGLTVLQPGVVSGASAKTRFDVEELHGFRGRVAVNDGPAVWLRFGEHDFIIPTARPRELAREIDRRRRRVVRHGGYVAAEIYQRLPELRNDLPLHGAPQSPPSLPSITWTPTPSLPPGQPSPPARQRPPRPWHDVAGYLPDLTGDLPGALLTYRPDLRRDVVVDNVEFVVGRAGLSFPRLFDPEEKVERTPHALTWGYTRVIEAGHLKGVPPGTTNAWLIEGDKVPSRAAVVDGPAVWVWGHLGEFLLCVDDAERIAAEMELRRATYLAHGNDDFAWLHYPDSKPAGPFTPPAPPYAPVAPTLVPQGCWHPF